MSYFSERFRHVQHHEMHPQSQILRGEHVVHSAEKHISHFALQISHKLAEYPHLMRQFAPHDIEERMRGGLFVLITEEHLQQPELLACAQVWKDDEGVAEVGTWLKLKDSQHKSATSQTIHRLSPAQLVMREGARLGMEMEGIGKVIAIVRQTNEGAQKSITSMGAEYMKSRHSKFVRDEEGNFAMMNVYDVTNLATLSR